MEPFVAIKPNGRLAGYFVTESELLRVADVNLRLLEKAVETQGIFIGLKWMTERSFRDKFTRQEDLSFPKPRDYEKMADKYMSQELVIQRNLKRELIEIRKQKIEEMRERKRLREEAQANALRETRRSARRGEIDGKPVRVRCIEDGIEFASLAEAAMHYGVTVDTVVRRFRKGDSIFGKFTLEAVVE